MKTNIKELVDEIFKWANVHHIGKDFGVYYGDRVRQWRYSQTQERYVIEELRDINPLDYCEWFSEKFIGGMWYDGEAYSCINGYAKANAYEKLVQILEKYGLYLEPCDDTRTEFAPEEDIEKYEYTEFHRDRPIYLYNPVYAPDGTIKDIMCKQYELAKEVGDHGSCTIGEYIEYRYKGKLYRQCMQTPYQGDQSWIVPLPKIEALLAEAGAEDIHVNYGRLD